MTWPAHIILLWWIRTSSKFRCYYHWIFITCFISWSSINYTWIIINCTRFLVWRSFPSQVYRYTLTLTLIEFLLNILICTHCSLFILFSFNRSSMISCNTIFFSLIILRTLSYINNQWILLLLILPGCPNIHISIDDINVVISLLFLKT
jgi:hypothetical protein